tara:strand:+ start:455 stop:811 length:357 start_codon:yes stop_codon:yes gene_type:complete
MKLKWEKNTRVMDLVNQGKIDFEDVIPRTQTANFPAETATVRLAKVREKHPFVTVHIRGKNQPNQWGYINAPTCRINFGGQWQGKKNTAMDSNGDLDENLTWLDVHNVVERTKQALEI